MPIYVTGDITTPQAEPEQLEPDNPLRSLYEAHLTDAQLLAALLGIANRKAGQLLDRTGIRELASLLPDEMAHLMGLPLR